MRVVCFLWAAWWVGCGQPVPPITGFEGGTTADLGPLWLAGPSEDADLRQREKGALQYSSRVDERIATDDISVALVEEPVLHGTTAVRLGGRIGTLAIQIDRPELVGRRVEVRFWQRPEGTRVDARLLWLAGDVPFEEHLGDPTTLLSLWESGELLTLGAIELAPTGRRTFDGWEEWASGPVDHAFGGEAHLTPLLVFRDATMDPVRLYRSPVWTDRTVLVDALQLVDIGRAAVPVKTCRLADQASRCGRQGACALGRCVDAAARYGQVPHDPGVRADLAERRANELEAWTGGRQIRAEGLPTSVEQLRELDDSRTPVRRWWQGYTGAYRDLGDGHSAAQAPLVFYDHGGLCVDLGIADLLEIEEPLPLVTHHFGDEPWVGVVELGDVLVEVDGIPVHKWLEDHAAPQIGPAGDASYQQVSGVTLSMVAAVAAGSRLTFARCPGTEPCGANFQTFDVDLAEAAASVWEQPPELPSVVRRMPHACDHRLAPVDSANRGRGTAGVARRRGALVLQLNGFSSAKALSLLADRDPARLVIDARAGTGGSIYVELALAGMLTSEQDHLGVRVDPLLERAPADEAAYTACTLAADAWCFGSYFYALPASGWLRDAQVVLLNHKAISGNDLFSLHVQERCSADDETCGTTTLLGGADTAGAYAPPVSAPTYLGSRRGPWLTPYDMKLVYDVETTSDYLVGDPVQMDELVLQRQSDAVQGIDTQLEAALEAL